MAEMTITEVSQKYQISADTLRYYERIGLLPPIPRRSNGHRYFSDGMQHFLEMVICLRQSGVGVESLVEYVTLMQAGDTTLSARQILLEEQLALLKKKQVDLNHSIARLEHKISLYKTGEIKEDKSYFAECGFSEGC